MAKDLYQVTIYWSENTENSHFVNLTKRQADFLEKRFQQAAENGEITGFKVGPAEPFLETYDTLMKRIQETSLRRYFGPKEWTPEAEKEKSWPFIEIEEGNLVCSHCGPGDETLSFAADEEGAEALGKELASRKIRRWLYSSSVDFPTEYGARDIGFRSIIEAAAGREVPGEWPPW